MELLGREGQFQGAGGEYQRLAGAPAGLAGLRVDRARPVDGRLGLTIRPVPPTRCHIGEMGLISHPLRYVVPVGY